MSYSSEVLADSPHGYWRMAEASGAINDSSGNTNNSTTTDGSPGYSQTGPITTDAADTAISFNGSSGFVVPDHSTLKVADLFTLECWIKRADSDTGEHSLFSKYASYGMYLFSNMLELAIPGSVLMNDTTVTITNDGLWHHCVLTKNGSTIKAYIDGVDRTGSTSSSTCTDSVNNLNIAQEDGGVSRFNGSIDEIAVYANALSAIRVSAHYNAALSAPNFPLRTTYPPAKFGPF